MKTKEILCKYCLSTETCCTDVESETCENLEQLNSETSSTEKALIWWDTLPVFGIPSKEYYIGLYYSDDDVTPERIEEIYDKEVLEPKRQKEWQESQVNRRYSKPNAKEFKQFDESLFRAYIDKLPESESLNMIKIIYENKLPDCKFKAYLDKWFKL